MITTLLTRGRDNMLPAIPYGLTAISLLVVFAFPQYSLGQTLATSSDIIYGTPSESPYAKAASAGSPQAASATSADSTGSPQASSVQAGSPQAAKAASQAKTTPAPYIVINSTSIQAPIHPAGATVSKSTATRMWLVVTAYSSTPDQTDATPFITANGSHVRDGIIAANFLRFGTKVLIPTMYGDKVFTVEDRMNARHSYRVDIWMPTREEAIQFGSRIMPIEIIQD